MKYIVIGVSVYVVWILHIWFWIGMLTNIWTMHYYPAQDKMTFTFLGVTMGLIIGVCIGALIYQYDKDKGKI